MSFQRVSCSFAFERTASMSCYAKYFAEKDPLWPVEIDCKRRFCALPEKFELFREKLFDFKIYDDDVWIVTFPKAGTTWMQEMAWLILNDCDFKTAKSTELFDRSPYFEMEAVSPFASDFKKIDDIPRPRLIKTHLPLPFLPRQIWRTNSKIIYVARNPKDCIVSFYHFGNNIRSYTESLENYVAKYVKDEGCYMPFWNHVSEFWQLRDNPKVFFITYERMKADIRNVLTELATFLLRTIPINKKELLINHVSFKNMKDNPACNHTKILEKAKSLKPGNTSKDEGFRFMRKGIVGSYKSDLTQEMIDKIDKHTLDACAQLGLKAFDVFGISHL